MNTTQKRFLLFLFGCIGTRTLLVYLAKTDNKTYLQYMGYLSILPAIGFFYLFLSGSRKTGAEVFGDKIWWNDLRPVHSILYFLFAYNAIIGNKESWVYLLIDVAFGLILLASSNHNGVINLGKGNGRRIEDVLNILKKSFPKLNYNENVTILLF